MGFTLEKEETWFRADHVPSFICLFQLVEGDGEGARLVDRCGAPFAGRYIFGGDAGAHDHVPCASFTEPAMRPVA